MTPRTLSVVIPAYNAADDIAETLGALIVALERAPDITPEVVLVDDGSTDGTADIANSAAAGRIPFRVVTQPNQGRFAARRTGLDSATGEWVLLLDSRVTVDPNALAYVTSTLDNGRAVWNGHVHVADGGAPFGIFWRLLAELAWSDYFDNPREASFGVEDFDRYPKGTGCFIAPRRLLIDGLNAFQTGYADINLANDDTRLIRWIAERDRIHLSPRFSCTYKPRTRLRPFFRHAVHRGVVFLDGHGNRQSRFLPGVIAFYPVSAALAVAAVRRPLAVPVATALAVGAASAGLAAFRGRPARDVFSLFVSTPVYATGHGLGMWKGLAKMAAKRFKAP